GRLRHAYFLASASFFKIAITNKMATAPKSSISPTSFKNAAFAAEPSPTFTAKTTNNKIAPYSGMSRSLPIAKPNLSSCKPFHF
ncbi:MAG: hypothetical protein MUQ96_00880, partial [Loktanella sp.]|nr:hypothetical protein [Loktanella sp.]